MIKVLITDDKVHYIDIKYTIVGLLKGIERLSKLKQNHGY
jgi:hypothetical protein